MRTNNTYRELAPKSCLTGVGDTFLDEPRPRTSPTIPAVAPNVASTRYSDFTALPAITLELLMHF
jgi:hypothetical protein